MKCYIYIFRTSRDVSTEEGKLQTCDDLLPKLNKNRTHRYDLQVVAAVPGSESSFARWALHCLTGKLCQMLNKCIVATM